MGSTIERIGVLTGGGDCPGLNAVIRAVYFAATRRHGWQVLGIEDSFNGLIDTSARSPAGNRWLTREMVRGTIARGGTILGTTNRGNPFRYVPPEDPAGREIDVSDQVIANIRALGLDALICIGGDGTMEIAHLLSLKGVRLVGVPKTIDNDLCATDSTFGFDTAVNIAVEAIDRLKTTAESHDRVMFVEVMGRHAGWIALHAGIAGGADAILIPEIPYSIDVLARHVERRKAHGRPWGVVVVAEGAAPQGGRESYLSESLPGEARRLGGAAEEAARALCRNIQRDVRVTVLGHIQRGGTPSAIDRILATRFGVKAVELIAHGRFERMVCLRTPRIESVPISEAIARRNLVDPHGDLVGAAREVGVCFGDVDEPD